jgi:AAA domain, putative AbiEii toxin, Type IV TA system
MKLKSFNVQGFRNLTGSATFGPLHPINVLHGANNSGKTNVLQAMEVYFRLLRSGNHISKEQVVTLEAAGNPAGYPFDAIFNVQAPAPIRWLAEISIAQAELEDVGIEPKHPTDHIAIGLELAPGLGGAQLRVTRFLLGDVDAAAKDPGRDGPVISFAQQIRAHIARTYALEAGSGGAPFALLDVAAAAPEAGGLVPQTLRDALFDARQSLKREERRRWSLFVQMARELEPELGRGEFDTAFDRATGRAGLVYDSGDAAVPVDSLGSGIQKFVALLASLVLSRSMFVGLAEPEAYLSYSLQQRLGRVLKGLAENGGPQQFFISSHSTALDDAENSFVLEVQEGALVITQRPWRESGAPPPPPPLPAREPAREFGDAAKPASPPVTAAATPAAAPEAPAAAAPDLDALIGLVDQLSELDPVELVAHGNGPADAPPAAAATPAARPNAPPANGERVVDAAPWRRPGGKR